MQKRSYIRLVSYIGFILAIITTTAIISTTSLRDTRQELEVSYQQSLTELDECLTQVNTDITKSLYSNDYGEIYDLSRDLYAQCSTAKNAMSRLPIKQMELNGAYKFLSQCSDYAQYIGLKVDNNEKITDKERENLKVLLKYCESFNKSTNQMVSSVSNGAKIIDYEVKAVKKTNTNALTNNFSQSAKTFEDFPTLIYDGPFSDQVINKNSKLVSGKRVYSKEECRKIAAKALNLSIKNIITETDDQSKIPCYTFKSGRYTILITKQGGFVKEMLYSAPIVNSKISQKNACNLAKVYLKNIGYNNMEVCYFATQDNICTVNFAYKKGKITYYSDLIKVGVSMENGKIISLDAKTYLTNHQKRKLNSIKLSLDNAKNRVSNYLTIKNSKLCVIPKESGKEVLCYEFTCNSKDTGEDALIYINCENGKEEDILLLLKADNGTMVK